MASGRGLLAGAAWSYGAQALSAVAQIGYAAITSRLVSPDGFGTYAVALAVAGFVNLLATGGLAQSASRLLELDVQVTRALSWFALLLGGVVGAAMIMSAPVWTIVWRNSDALMSIYIMSIAAMTAPILSLCSGLMRRQGKFKQLAAFTLATNLAGMVIAITPIMLLRSAESLLVSPIVAQVLLLLLCMVQTRRLILGRPSIRGAADGIGFTWRVTIASVMSYLVYTTPKWSVSTVIGPVALGLWNRADTITAVPFQQAQTALIQVVYPEFRHDVNSAGRARSAWTDMLVLTSWLSLPVAAAGAAILAPLSKVIFGPGWDGVLPLIAPLVLAAGLQVNSTLLASAVEALGRFRWVYVTQALLLALQAVVVGAVFVTHSLLVAVWAGVATAIFRHIVHVTLCSRAGYLALGPLLRGYAGALGFALSVFLASDLTVQLLYGVAQAPGLWAVVPLPTILVATVMWISRARIPALVIARRYGIL